MTLALIDGIIIISFFVVSIGIGIWVSKKGNKDSKDYFLAGGNMPWWFLGVSMVATTFSTDTPNFVTQVVRENGVSGNWDWWAFLLTGMLTVFISARLWKKSGVMPDVEFYDIRYSGPEARFLRGFRALYLGVVFNVLIMASVTLAAIKIGGVLLGLSPVETVVIAGIVTVIYSSIGGLKGVIFTDFIQFFLSMGGALAAAIISLNHPKVGGLSNLISNEAVRSKMAFIPDFSDPTLYLSIFLIPLLVQWWNVWYPGAEPGGGGYVAQRMLSAKNEEEAVKSVFFFNIVHYAVRPWPWIIVAFCSILVFPDLESLQQAFPAVEKVKHDLAYPAMLTFLPAGILGLVVTSLIAAYMSTISTHLNWGASYLVNDLYKTQIKKEASEKEQVQAGRVATIILMVISALMALAMNNALQLFNIIIMFGAGTGLIFILRWFWWRINAWTEISAMLASGTISMLLTFTPLGEIMFGDTGWMPTYYQFPFIVVTTSIIWLIVTYLTQPESQETLARFYQKTTPGGKGWKKIVAQMTPEQQEASQTPWIVPQGILAMLLGCAFVYGSLFSTGYFIYGETTNALITLAIVIISGILLLNVWKRMKKITDEST